VSAISLLFLSLPRTEITIELVIKAMKLEREKRTGIIIITHLLPPNLDEDRVLSLATQ
tara:strand:- start:455 stop:628 length:174 start_codon:yes stop_codon:yes gene_type:complete